MSWTMLEVEDLWSEDYWEKLGHQACWNDGRVKAAKILRELHDLASIATFAPSLPYGFIRQYLHTPFGGDLFARFVNLMVWEIALAQDELLSGLRMQLSRQGLDMEWGLSGLTCVKPKRRHE